MVFTHRIINDVFSGKGDHKLIDVTCFIAIDIRSIYSCTVSIISTSSFEGKVCISLDLYLREIKGLAIGSKYIGKSTV